jgi:competence ComEA-like helix-hairpin-helix protein
MKLKKTEIALIAVTLAFVCFTAGFFTGRGAASNVITVERGPVENSSPSGSKDHIDVSDAPIKADSPGETSADTGAVSPPEETPSVTIETISPPEGSLPAEHASEKLNINTADKAELIGLPGIGEVLAQRIIDYRNEHGGFQTIEQIKDVSGIGEAKFNAIKDIITAG